MILSHQAVNRREKVGRGEKGIKTEDKGHINRTKGDYGGGGGGDIIKENEWEVERWQGSGLQEEN